MTLEQLKDYIKSVSEAHVDVKKFDLGSQYNTDQYKKQELPLVFLELPYFVTYNPQLEYDSVQFALNVYYGYNNDNPQADHEAISKAKEIGDAIMVYIKENQTSFIINNITSVSVREYTDDSVAGMRYDWTISLVRDICSSSNFKNYFNTENING